MNGLDFTFPYNEKIFLELPIFVSNLSSFSALPLNTIQNLMMIIQGSCTKHGKCYYASAIQLGSSSIVCNIFRPEKAKKYPYMHNSNLKQAAATQICGTLAQNSSCECANLQYNLQKEQIFVCLHRVLSCE